MAKVTLERNAFLAPVPVTLLSCVGADGSANLMTVSWTSVACAIPAMVSVAIRTDRQSYLLIRETGEFVLNIPPTSLARDSFMMARVSSAAWRV